MRVGLALLAVYLIWGSTYLANRVALQSFPPVLMSALRFLIAGGLFFVWLRIRGVPTPSLREWIGAAIVGALLPAAGSGGAAYAQQWIASGLAAVATATIPLWASLFAGLWGRWPSRPEWVALVCGFIGVGLLHLEGGLFHRSGGACVRGGELGVWFGLESALVAPFRINGKRRTAPRIRRAYVPSPDRPAHAGHELRLHQPRGRGRFGHRVGGRAYQ